MADIKNRLAQNAAGPFYVDDSCTDCDLCRNIAPEVFKRDEEIGLSFVHRQPATDEERALAREAVEGCPTESIGNDGLREPDASPNSQITKAVV